MRRFAATGIAVLALAGVLPDAAAAAPPDGRGWELVTPVAKNGGQVLAPGQLSGGGAFAAAAGGGALTYSAPASFGEAVGAPPLSQYLATRGAGGWSNANVSPPALSGSYPEAGSPYQLFSPDLGAALLSNGKRCRGDASAGCPVANPPLPGSGGPPGYRNYYLRRFGSGDAALITAADAPALTLPADEFEVTLAGASGDLGQVALSSCAKLTADAVEVPGGEGCDPAAPNLYIWSGGALRAVNHLPAEPLTTPGAALAAPLGAISADGSRVYFSELEDGFLYLREGGATKLVAGGGGAAFQTASADGRFAFYTQGGQLFRYDAVAEASTPVAGEALAVLGAAEDGPVAYYVGAGGAVFRWAGGGSQEIAAAAAAGDYPPATGTARVSADGSRLLFLSEASLTGYDNHDRTSGEPDAELYLYDASAAGSTSALACLSCRPSGARPGGDASLPAAIPNGSAPGAIYRPRVLVEAGRRVFFESADAILSTDTDGRPDVYEWEAQGVGSCEAPAGCLGLISSGRSGEASFLDASASGGDAYFFTDSSLVGADPGAVDIYDAREGGGFPEPPVPIPCEGDACQGPAPAPEEQTPSTSSFTGPTNPPVRAHKVRKHHPKHRRHRHPRRRP